MLARTPASPVRLKPGDIPEAVPATPRPRRRRARFAWIAALGWVLGTAPGCGGDAGGPPAADRARTASREPAARPDSTRILRQQIAYLESIRSFGDGRLFEACAHPDARVRRAAVMALGRIQDPAAVNVLLPRLEDPDAGVSRQAAWALRQMPPLDEATRHRVQSALVTQLQLHPLPETWPYLEALAPHAGPASLDELGKMVAAGLLAGSGSAARPPRVEGMAAIAIAHIDDRRAVRILSQLGDLTNRAPEAAWRIAHAMTIRRDSLFYRPLRSLLRHDDPTARAAGARALGKLGIRAAVPALHRALADLDWRVRARALAALGELADSTSAAFAAAMIADTHPLVRQAALEALRDLPGNAAHVELVKPALRDSVAAVRLAALQVMARGAPRQAVEAFHRARRDPVAFVRHAALGEAVRVLGMEAGLDSLQRAARARDLQERIAARAALGAAPPAPPQREAAICGVLRAGLSSGDFVEATVAAEALGQRHDGASLDALVAIYARRQDDHHDRDVRLAVVGAIGELLEAADLSPSQAARADSLLRAALAADDPRIAHAAASARARHAGEPPPPAPVPRARPWDGTFPAELPPIDLGRVRLRLVTARGEARLELDGDRFPRTVAAFLRCVDRGVHDDGVFHRVVPAFVVQGGDPRGDGWGDAGWLLPCEYGDLRYDRAGVIGMAHAGKDTGGSQFFITHLPAPRLDGRYTAFGWVVDGMPVIDRIVRGDRFRIERAAPASGAALTSEAPDPPRSSPR